jgi:hypothetical protein
MTKREFLKRLIQLTILAILAYFIVPLFADSLREFDPSEWRLNYWYLLASLAVMQLVFFAQAGIWSIIVGFFGKRVALLKAFRIAYLAQLGRYIPGKFWQLFGMIYLAGREGIKKEEATLSFILSQLFSTPPGILLVVLYLFVLQSSPKYAEYAALAWIAAASLVVFMVVFLKPGWLRLMVNWLIRLVRQPEVEFTIEKRLGLKALSSYFVTWNLYGIAFYLFLRSILPEVRFSVVEIIGAWTLGYLVGYWTVVLPAGIGAREAVLLVLLVPVIGSERAGIAVMGARAWTILGEVICSLLAWRVKQE